MNVEDWERFVCGILKCFWMEHFTDDKVEFRTACGGALSLMFRPLIFSMTPHLHSSSLSYKQLLLAGWTCNCSGGWWKSSSKEGGGRTNGYWEEEEWAWDGRREVKKSSYVALPNIEWPDLCSHCSPVSTGGGRATSLLPPPPPSLASALSLKGIWLRRSLRCCRLGWQEKAFGVGEPEQFRVESKLCQECREKPGNREERSGEQKKCQPDSERAGLEETWAWPSVLLTRPGSSLKRVSASGGPALTWLWCLWTLLFPGAGRVSFSPWWALVTLESQWNPVRFFFFSSDLGYLRWFIATSSTINLSIFESRRPQRVGLFPLVLCRLLGWSAVLPSAGFL